MKYGYTKKQKISTIFLIRVRNTPEVNAVPAKASILQVVLYAPEEQ